LPAQLKRQIGEEASQEFVLQRSLDKCLVLYTEVQWKKIEAKIERITEFNEKARLFKRKLLQGATRLYLDAAGRLLLPPQMLEYASITKDAILSSQTNKTEIWDAKAFYDIVQTDDTDMNALALEVMGPGFLDDI
jgi:MraZ protein